jgi:hypothetical protein
MVKRRRITQSRSKKSEVINMAIVLPQKQEELKKVEVRPAIVAKKPRNARELRDMLGCSGAFGRTLVDLHKQGR